MKIYSKIMVKLEKFKIIFALLVRSENYSEFSKIKHSPVIAHHNRKNDARIFGDSLYSTFRWC